MGLGAFKKLRQILGGAVADTDSSDLFKEVMLLTLARASDADTNVHPVEIAAVQKIVERETGEAVGESDVRVAAASELYEAAPLDSYLRAASRKLDGAQKITLLNCVEEVITVDRRVSSHEIAFYNHVATAITATPAEIAGLSPDH